MVKGVRIAAPMPIGTAGLEAFCAQGVPQHHVPGRKGEVIVGGVLFLVALVPLGVAWLREASSSLRTRE